MAEILQIISLNWPAAICLLLGFAFVAVELFTPGFGVPGVLGLALLAAGVFCAADSVLEAIILAIIILLVLVVITTIAMHSAQNGALAKSPLVLKDSATKQDGFTSGEDLGYFMGREGVTTTFLRPVGTADFDGVKLEVLSEGEFIEGGTSVKVVKVEGRKLVVRKI